MNLKKQFAASFFKADIVILCPIYAAGEKKDKNYNELHFVNLIKKTSKVQVIIIKNEVELKKYMQKNLINNEIIVGMGAGSISKWMRDLKYQI
jgi:UDP-N-acetylmuramate--alanine ligase